LIHDTKVHLIHDTKVHLIHDTKVHLISSAQLLHKVNTENTSGSSTLLGADFICGQILENRRKMIITSAPEVYLYIKCFLSIHDFSVAQIWTPSFSVTPSFDVTRSVLKNYQNVLKINHLMKIFCFK
jgi:hypothetical protein